MKKLVLFLFYIVSISAKSQSDSLKFAQLDSLSPEQLLEYYINEPEPIQFYKGPVEIGDSAYNAIHPLTIPTETVHADPLFRYSIDGFTLEDLDTTSRAEQALKPKIAIGFGKLGYSGDLYSKHFQPAMAGRPAFNLDISQRLTHYLQLDFTVLFGKVSANENLPDRHENFVSEIRSGGVNLLYDFGNFIPNKYRIRPFVSIGVSGFEFLSKTDVKDKDGNTYHYWSDGSIKDKAEGSAEAQNAQDLVRDYTNESDVRELNIDGFGKYSEKAVAMPLGVGVITKITDRIDLKLNWQYYFSSTDYIDGITEKSTGNRAGNKKSDNFSYASFAVQYDLIGKVKPKSKQYSDTLSDAFWLAFNSEDKDNDSIPDLQDDCLGTVSGAKVDLKGCPLDEDMDGVPNYKDEEPNTAPGAPVNVKGVTLSNEYMQAYYDAYNNDSIATEKETQYITNAFAAAPKKTKKKKKEEYTVELVRYTGPIPSDELAYLLSIGDINSTTLDDGSTVVYTTGKYDNLADAIKRKEEFKLSGNKEAKVAKVQGNNFAKIEEEDLDALLRKELEELMSLSISEDGDTLFNPLDSLAGLDDLFPNDPSKGGGKKIERDSLGNPIAGANNQAESPESFGKDDIVYRVQLGAFRNKISTSVFNTSTNVLELKTAEDIYRYVTRGYKSIEQAASVRADLVIQGYSDAFVTAYKGGKRIPLSQTKATVEKTYVEDMNEDKIFSSIDKSLVAFKIQLGAPVKKQTLIGLMEEKTKDLNDLEKQTTSAGGVRYTSGSFASYTDAEKHRKSLEDKGFSDAFIIATFKNVQIPIQEALELLK